MDELDSAIVRELQLDGRQSNRDLARRVGVAPSTCLERVRQLRNRGVLRGYRAEVDLAKLNRGVQAFVATQIRPLSRSIIDNFKAWAITRPEVLAVTSSPEPTTSSSMSPCRATNTSTPSSSTPSHYAARSSASAPRSSTSRQ